MPRTIVVPMDESPSATRVLPFTVRVAEAMDASIVLVRAIPHQDLRAHAAKALEWVMTKLPNALPRATVIRVGNPAAVIAQVALEEHASLVTMVTDHQSAVDRLLNDSVADEVLRRTTAPVLLIPALVPRPWPERGMCILVPLDGSALSETVLEPALDLAKAMHARLQLVRASHTPLAARVYLEQIAQRLADRGAPVTFEVLAGNAPAEIASAAREQSVDVIAMATHGRTGLARLAAGSVATTIVEHAEWPVLLVRPAIFSDPDPEPEETEQPMFVGPLPWLVG